MSTTTSTTTVHHLPSANPTLDEQVAALLPGQWVRVTWHDAFDGTHGVVEGVLRQPTNLRSALFVGTYCLCVRGLANITATKVETEQPAALDMDVLAGLVEEWGHAMQAVDDKPVGRFGTGSNDAEQNAAYEAERAVRAYLKGVRV